MLTEVPPPAKHRMFLWFLDEKVEWQYQIFVRRFVASKFPYISLFGAIMNTTFLIRVLDIVTPLTTYFLAFGSFTMLLASIVLLSKMTKFEERAGLLLISFIAVALATSMAWGQIGGWGSICPVLYISGFLPFFGFYATYILPEMFVGLALQFFWTNPLANGGVPPNFLLLGRSFGYLMLIWLMSICVEDSCRKSFSSFYVISKINEQLSSESGNSENGPVSEVELLRKTLQTANTMNLALKEKTEEVEKAMQAKEQFMATMSHEIRSPLHSIIALSSLLMDSTAAVGQEERSMLTTIHTSSEHLMTIVNDILDYTRIQAKRMQLAPEKFRLQSFSEGVVGIMAPLVRPGVDFVSTVNSLEDTELIGDSARLKQICCNLLSNAAKFTHKGSISFSVQMENDKNDSNITQVSLTVTDTGIGMSEEYLTRMYTPFEQSDKTISRQYGGTGLGLVITKQLTDLFGGEIYCESTLGEGTSFTVKVPLRRVVEPQESMPLLIDASALVITSSVFVMDDSLSYAVKKAMRHWLELAGAVVVGEEEYLEARTTRSGGSRKCSVSENLGNGSKGLNGDGLDKKSARIRNRKSNRDSLELPPAAWSVANCDSNSGDDLRVNTMGQLGGGGEEGRVEAATAATACLDAIFGDNTPCDEAIVYGICSEYHEDDFMSRLGMANELGRVIVVTRSRAAEAVAALRAAAIATAAAPAGRTSSPHDSGSSSSHPPLFSQRSNHHLQFQVASPPSSTRSRHNSSDTNASNGGGLGSPLSLSHRRSISSPKAAGFSWRRVICELPLTGSSVLRAAAEVVLDARSARTSISSPSSDFDSIHFSIGDALATTATGGGESPNHSYCELETVVGVRRNGEMKTSKGTVVAGSNDSNVEQQGSTTGSDESGSSNKPNILAVSSSSSGEKRISRHHQQQQRGKPEFSSLRVLLVDDNAINRKVGEQLLKRCGVDKIETAENGLEAVEAVERAIREGKSEGCVRFGYDVVLMDLHMPVMDGSVAAREILSRCPDITIRPVVVACTADVFVAKDLEAMPISITKPFTYLQLGNVLQECAMRRRTMQ